MIVTVSLGAALAALATRAEARIEASNAKRKWDDFDGCTKTPCVVFRKRAAARHIGFIGRFCGNDYAAQSGIARISPVSVEAVRPMGQ
jgi:hypothetical protein